MRICIAPQFDRNYRRHVLIYPGLKEQVIDKITDLNFAPEMGNILTGGMEGMRSVNVGLNHVLIYKLMDGTIWLVNFDRRNKSG